jgi:hypothetical protein
MLIQGQTRSRRTWARAFVGTGSDVLIGGTIIRGNGTSLLRVLVRALGPSLASAGVTTPLANPTLSLRDANGNVIASNDNWKDSQQAAIAATGKAPPNDNESAILGLLAPGNYTAIVAGKNGTTGVALIEFYSLPWGTTSFLLAVFLAAGDNNRR